MIDPREYFLEKFKKKFMKSLQRYINEGILNVNTDKINSELNEIIDRGNLFELIDGRCTITYSRVYGFSHYEDIVDDIKHLENIATEHGLRNTRGKECTEAKGLARAISALLNEIFIDKKIPVNNRPNWIINEFNKLCEKHIPGLRAERVLKSNAYLVMVIYGHATVENSRTFEMRITIPKDNLIVMV